MTQPTLDDQLLDEAWLTAPARRSRGRLVLIGLLTASVCFLGGALVQKHYGTTTATAGGVPGGAAGFPEGFPDGSPDGFPGGTGGSPGSGQDGSQGSTATPGQGGATGAVIGRVVRIDGNTWTVQDLGGTRHRVTVTGETDLTREEALTTDQVDEGDTVNVTGTLTGNQLTADQITLR